MAHAMKIAVTLPLPQYKQIEAFRRKKGLSRSGVIHTAIAHWLNCSKEQKKIVRYLEGYKEKPENPEEWEAFEKVQSSHLASEDWS